MTSVLLTMLLLAGCGAEDSAPTSGLNSDTPPVSDNPAPDPDPDPDSSPTGEFFAPDYAVIGQPFLVVASDSGSNGLTYDWGVTESPAGSNPTLRDAGAAASILTDVTGEYTLSLTVSDDQGQSGTTARSIIVLPSGEGPVITSMAINSRASLSETESNVPITFGQIFAIGDVPENFSVAARLENGDTAPLQVDAKTWYPDGSLKHAVLTTIIPSLQGGQQLDFELITCEDHPQLAPVDISNLPAGYDAVVTLNIGGTNYTATLSQSMSQSSGSNWLSGPVVTEAHFKTRFVDGNDNEHPLLTARFQLRLYDTGAVRTDIIVENTDAFPNSSGNISYTATLTVGGSMVMAPETINHHHHSRWRKTVWFGADPRLHLERDVNYLISTGAIPNYDLSIDMLPSVIAGLESSWNNNRGARSNIPVSDIMGAGLAAENMPGTGGRIDLGLLPGWTAIYLYTMAESAANATFGTAEASAHWPVHYRDAATDLAVSLEDYPAITIHPNVSNNPSNPLPSCSNCSTSMEPDTAHQPSLVFVPYLLTGDYYYLEELHFWTNWNAFYTEPSLRDWGNALYRFQQTRAQAWSMRTLLQTVFITPDDHPLKGYFQTQLDNNFQFYMTQYVNNPAGNQLGYILPGYTNPSNASVIVSAWQDDFFTTIMNYARHLGFDQVQPILDWKLQFAEGRMDDSVFCWQFATTYRFIASAPLPGPLFGNFAVAYIPTLQFNFSSNWQAIAQAECGSAAMTAAAGFTTQGDFAGFPNHPVGYPAALRPVVAAAVELNQGWASIAWSRLINAPRQPAWTTYPNFAILPRL